MSAEMGRLTQAVTNAVLALYGYPEPHPTTPIYDIASLLDGLAAERRAEGAQ